MKKIKVLKILPIFGAFAVCLSANITPKYEVANASDELASAIAGFSQLKVESQLSFNYYFEDYTYEPISHVEDINDDDVYAIAGYIGNGDCMTIHNGKNDEGFNDGMEAVPAYSYGGYLRDLDQRISFTKNEDGLSYKMRFSRNSSDYYFATTLNDNISLYNVKDPYPAGSLFETLKFNDASFTEDDLNPNFTINFDEDGYLVLKSYSLDPTYAFKDDVLTLALGGPNYKIPFFDMMSETEKVAWGNTYKVKLFRHVNKPNWRGDHYRKVTNISGLAENKNYVLVTPNSIKYEDEYHAEFLKDAFMSKSQKLSVVENDGYRDFIKADSNQEILTFTYDNTNKAYRIYAENKGYWKIVEFGDLDVFSLNYDAEGMGNLFDLNFDSNGDFTIIEHKTKSVLVSAKDIGFSDYKADYLFIEEGRFGVFGFDKLHLYKKTNLDTIYKGRPTLCHKLNEDNFAACDVVSVRLQLFVPAEIYNVLKTDWKFYMTYSFDPNPNVIGDEQTIKQELHNDHLDANGNARFSVVFKDIELKDIDINITSYCEVSSNATGEERVTYSRFLNEGNGYSIRDMVNKYLSMKDSQNPDEVAEYERSIKPHKEMLECIQNY